MKLKSRPQTISLSLLVIATALPIRRDLAGMVGGLLDPGVHGSSITPISDIAKQSHSSLTTTSTLLSFASETTKGDTSRRTTASIFTETMTMSSTLDTSAITTTTEADNLSTSTSPWPTQTPNNHIAQDASHMAPEEATEWKVIGITVLSITVIGSMMLAALFSDTWIKLVKDVILGGNMKQKRYGDEELVPDWKRRSWEYMLADEEGHRYPTVSASLQSLAENGEKKEMGGQPTQATTAATPMVPLPAPSYIPELDPHPLEPLFRRPSLKYQ